MLERLREHFASCRGSSRSRCPTSEARPTATSEAEAERRPPAREPARPVRLTVELTDGPAATEAVGARLAAELAPGAVVLVSGELGSGKTTLVRGACRALGVREPVVSPTFTIGRRYRGDVPISHLDLYRLDGLEPEEPGLLDDYLTADAIAFVEWPEAGAGARAAPRGSRSRGGSGSATPAATGARSKRLGAAAAWS